MEQGEGQGWGGQTMLVSKFHPRGRTSSCGYENPLKVHHFPFRKNKKLVRRSNTTHIFKKFLAAVKEMDN